MAPLTECSMTDNRAGEAGWDMDPKLSHAAGDFPVLTERYVERLFQSATTRKQETDTP